MKEYRLDTDRMKEKIGEKYNVKKWHWKTFLAKCLIYSVMQIDRLKKKAPHIINALKHYEEITGDSMSNVIKEIPCVKKKK